MDILFTWRIDKLKTRNEIANDGTERADVVVEVLCTRTGITADGLYTGSASYGSTIMSAVDTTQEDFIRFEDLTEEQVFEWMNLDDNMDTSGIDDIIRNEIELQKNPITDRDPPWL